MFLWTCSTVLQPALLRGENLYFLFCVLLTLYRWSEFATLPASDGVFNLSILSLRKLKPYRDFLYVKRTTPDLAVFGMAYRAIKLWATQHGIYSSKFGYLGGVHITLMLSWVYKRIAHDIPHNGAHTISVSDLIATFFHYYATFDWANDIVYDAFFHKEKPRYHRTAREPMAVLGFHPPNSNIAHTSTVPGVLVLVRSFKAASAELSDESMTWKRFFDPAGNHSLIGLGLGESQFLQTYKSYACIDIQFWGRTLAKGKGLVGWVESRCLSLVVGRSPCHAFRLTIANVPRYSQTSTRCRSSYVASTLHGQQA